MSWWTSVGYMLVWCSPNLAGLYGSIVTPDVLHVRLGLTSMYEIFASYYLSGGKAANPSQEGWFYSRLSSSRKASLFPGRYRLILLYVPGCWTFFWWLQQEPSCIAEVGWFMRFLKGLLLVGLPVAPLEQSSLRHSQCDQGHAVYKRSSILDLALIPTKHF